MMDRLDLDVPWEKLKGLSILHNTLLFAILLIDKFFLLIQEVTVSVWQSSQVF